MLEFVDSGLYFVQDKSNFINPLLQVVSGSVEKSTGSGSGGLKINGSCSIFIIIILKEVKGKFLYRAVKIVFNFHPIHTTQQRNWTHYNGYPV